MSVSLKALKRRQLEQALLRNKIITYLKKRTFRRSFLLLDKREDIKMAVLPLPARKCFELRHNIVRRDCAKHDGWSYTITIIKKVINNQGGRLCDIE